MRGRQCPAPRHQSATGCVSATGSRTMSGAIRSRNPGLVRWRSCRSTLCRTNDPEKSSVILSISSSFTGAPASIITSRSDPRQTRSSRAREPLVQTRAPLGRCQAKSPAPWPGRGLRPQSPWRVCVHSRQQKFDFAHEARDRRQAEDLRQLGVVPGSVRITVFKAGEQLRQRPLQRAEIDPGRAPAPLLRQRIR